MLSITHPSVVTVHSVFTAVMATATLMLATKPALANPASDQAFGNCVTAAAAYFETGGLQIGAVTILTRDGRNHRLRITSMAPAVNQTTILCTANRQTTAIEVISSRLAYDGSASAR